MFDNLAASFRLTIVLIIIASVTLIAVPIQLILIVMTPKFSRKIPMYWHRFILHLIGVRVHVHGETSNTRPLMLVANHISWSDILILGSITPLCFIAKDEVKKWPGINYLSRLQRTVFINRDRRSDVANQADSIAARLVEGDVMVLFAEGTTGDGNKLLPYKSALFGAPQSALNQHGIDEIVIQPVALAYNNLHGMPLGRFHQSVAAWPGDVPLASHLASFIKAGAFDVDVSFGDEHIFNEKTKRKIIAKEVFEQSRLMFAKMRRLNHNL
ncbi:MAG: 1-acyl-sn-glycerol-3-phosphate acyltransferase [Rhizobiales bacterium]|nr:1-acyl-sn-glycerol-3-phosphate acyltransferase [Hyphomicrobiales bacterium]